MSDLDEITRMIPLGEAKRRDPAIRHMGFGPDWWNHHGTGMRVTRYSEGHRLLVIEGSAAKLIISQVDHEHGSSKDGKRWYVDWEVRQSRQEYARGRIIAHAEELEAAFGVSSKSGYFGNHLLQRFGGDAAQQRTFIRWGNFLNIPGPGTAHDGDPNISIEIDDKMRNYIRQLVKS